jgi:hypothetical protein
MYYIEIGEKEVIISEEMVVKYNLHAGKITPFTRCEIKSKGTVKEKDKSTSDIIKIPDKKVISAADIIKAGEKQSSTADIIKLGNKEESTADVIKVKG